MNSCQQSEKIIPYLLGEMAAEEKGLFELHLESCAACRHELAIERSIDAELAAENDPGYIEAKTMARLRLRRSEGMRSFWLQAFRTAVYGLACAIACSVIVPMLLKLPFNAVFDLGKHVSAGAEALGRLAPANSFFFLIGAGYILFLAGSVYAVKHAKH